jgi:hypothetical protein
MMKLGISPRVCLFNAELSELSLHDIAERHANQKVASHILKIEKLS